MSADNLRNRIDTVKAWTNKNIFTTSIDNGTSGDHPMDRMDRPAMGSIDEGVAHNSEYNYDETGDASYQQTDGRMNGDANGGDANVDETDEHGIDGKMITSYQAAWNVTNAIQGMFIVGLPQAVRVGGWWAILALVGVAYICYYTGILLVQCLYDDKGKRVRSSYKAIAEECYPWGGTIVLGAQLTELLMTCILYLVLAGDLLEGSFPAIDKAGWMMLTATVLLPCAFLMDLTAVSRLSFWNTISHIVINVIILLYCLTQIGRWAWGSVRISLDINTFPTVMGVVVFSYTSHIFLPTLEGSMMERSEFQPMLKWSHIAAAVFKATFGFVGFLTFDEYTQDEISNSLPNQQFKVLVNLILMVKAVLSYPLPYFATVQIVRQNLFLGAPKTSFSGCFGADGSLREWALSLRICLVLFTLFMALSIPYFVLLMGLVGNITGTLLSFVWPTLFHLKIKGHTLTDRQKMLSYTIIGSGLCFGAVGLVYSSLLLSDAINEVKEYE